METKHSTKKRPKEQYDAVIEMAKTETNMSVIAKKFNLPWTTVRNWLRRTSKSERYPNLVLLTDNDIKTHIINNIGINEYSYMLGCYFGDGHISKFQNKITKQFHLATGTNTPKIIDFQSKLLTLFGNKIVVRKRKFNVVDIFTHNSDFDKIFPHTGSGFKHNRKIELTDWQKEIVNYKYILLGLFHSDGCAVKAYSRTRDNIYRYEFVNKSPDILEIYCNCLEFLNITYTKRQRINVNDYGGFPNVNISCNQSGSDIMFDLFGTKDKFSDKIFQDFNLTKIDTTKIRFSKIDLDTCVEINNIPEHLNSVDKNTIKTKELICELKLYFNTYDICEKFEISGPTFSKLCSQLGVVKQKYTKSKL
jgi:hypothetical protein